jgi:hypothetical protein
MLILFYLVPVTLTLPTLNVVSVIKYNKFRATKNHKIQNLIIERIVYPDIKLLSSSYNMV